ncbi:hypothetical protein HPB52_003488 [Rhipicephalus sanguineus]|uniref:CCHC-type domain-containing protein n=1 Tax=Rhipicephalus sanguineus TaxID=34632 RepID=A0A9D4T567_RHISA|nr:hypothetical protein HPB52_003488 [Rhipicephalus sanguineus]
MSRLSVELLREELERRSLATTGTKDDLVQRLHNDIQASRDSTPMPDQTPARGVDAAVATAFNSCYDIARPFGVNSELRIISATSVNAWLDEVRRVQQLASWDDATTRLIACSKLKGTARNWHMTFGHQHVTWQEWSNALKSTFSSELSLTEWQERVLKIKQHANENLRQYAFAKLRLVEQCPVKLSEGQKIDYLLQGLREQHVIAAIAASQPSTVRFYGDVRQSGQMRSARPNAALFKTFACRAPASSAPTIPDQPPRNSSPPPTILTPSRQRQRIADMPVHEQEAKYNAITAQYGAPAYRSGHDLSTATCFNCQQLGHLAARCPSPRAPRQRLPDNTPPHIMAMSCLEGSLLHCAVIEAHVAAVGTVDALRDSGSKITILTEDLVPSSALTPWKKPPISVVGGGTVMPAGTLSLSPEKKRSKSRERRISRSRDRSRRSKERKRRRTRKKERGPSREKKRNRHREKRSRSRDKRRSRSRENKRSISRDGRRSCSRDQRRSRTRKRPSRIRDRRRNRETRPRSRCRPRRSWTRAMLLQRKRSAEQLRNKSKKSLIVPVARAVTFVSPDGLTTTTCDANSSYLRHCHKPHHQAPSLCRFQDFFMCRTLRPRDLVA